MICNDTISPVFSIFLGDAKTLTLVAVTSDGSSIPPYKPLDLTTCTELVISLPNEDGTYLELKLSTSDVVIQTPAVLGTFSTDIESADSALLNVGELQTFNVTFTIGSEVFTVPYINALSVYEVQP